MLPALALGIVSSALITRFTRASMLDVLNDDYVRTARSKGMGEFRVVMKHAFKNALIPVLTVIGLTAALLVSGAVVTETVFGLPGVGNLVVSAVLRRDYPVIQGALLVIAALYVLINFAIDMLYLVDRPTGALLMAAASSPALAAPSEAREPHRSSARRSLIGLCRARGRSPCSRSRPAHRALCAEQAFGRQSPEAARASAGGSAPTSSAAISSAVPSMRASYRCLSAPSRPCWRPQSASRSA